MKDRELTNPFEATATLVRLGPAAAGDRFAAELLAGALDVHVKTATRLLVRLGGLQSLSTASDAELIAAGIHAAKARRLRQTLALARAAIGTRPIRGQRLAGAADVWTHLRDRLCALPVEEFWTIAVDVRHRVLFDELLARGSLTGVEIHPRDVFRPLIRAGAAAVILCHNHPSGDPSPSRADIELTLRLREVGDLCGITVLDHVVVGTEGYVSLAERGWR